MRSLVEVEFSHWACHLGTGECWQSARRKSVIVFIGFIYSRWPPQIFPNSHLISTPTPSPTPPLLPAPKHPKPTQAPTAAPLPGHLLRVDGGGAADGAFSNNFEMLGKHISFNLNVDCTAEGGGVEEAEEHQRVAGPRGNHQVRHQCLPPYSEKSSKTITEGLARYGEDKKAQLELIRNLANTLVRLPSRSCPTRSSPSTLLPRRWFRCRRSCAPSGRSATRRPSICWTRSRGSKATSRRSRRPS